jgi:hypothetical protein
MTLLHGDTRSALCGKCDLIVHKTHGFDVATRETGLVATLQEIRDFLHPPARIVDEEPEHWPTEPIKADYLNARHLPGKPIIVGDDTVVTRVQDGVVFAERKVLAPATKPSRKLAKYEPRPLAHEREPSPWLWRTLYAVITMTAAALTLWQALRVL